jgi:hypothetical protein
VKHRTSAYAVGSLVLFLLFATGTIIYCARAILSTKQLMCLVRTLEVDANDGRIKELFWCNGKSVLIPSPDGTGMDSEIRYKDTLDSALSLAFGIIAQLILFTADGLLVRVSSSKEPRMIFLSF